jgi:hypothetical protein
MSKLYVIGNGFDLHHGLKTSYYDFSEYLKENNPQLFGTLEKYISYPISDDSLWSRFEENLANLDADEILSENSDYLPNIASDDFRSRDLHTFPDIMHEQFLQLTSGLLSEFKNFILAVRFPDSAYEQKLRIDKDSIFLNFNYTNTLERLYNITNNQINYIHNSVYRNRDEIILGHGIDPENFEKEIPTPPDNLDEEDYEEWYRMNNDYDYSFDTGRESLYEYFKIMHKPTKQIIENNKIFFDSLDIIDEIYIFGHSISEVDILYFQKLAKSVSPNSKWSFSYYSHENIPILKNSLIGAGVKEDQISSIRLQDIQRNNTQLSLDFE